MPSIVILLREWMKVSRPPSTPTQDIFPQTNLGKNLLVEKKNCTRNSDIMNIHATSVQYLQLHLNRFKFIAKIQTHHSTYEIRSHKSWIRVIFLHRWPAVENDEKNLNTFWFYRTNETWQTYQRFYPNAWLVEEGVWKCCRRRLICKKHLILTMFLW